MKGAGTRGATLPPPARPHTIFRGIKENRREGRDNNKRRMRVCGWFQFDSLWLKGRGKKSLTCLGA